jgi:hypothetical protein
MVWSESVGARRVFDVLAKLSEPGLKRNLVVALVVIISLTGAVLIRMFSMTLRLLAIAFASACIGGIFGYEAHDYIFRVVAWFSAGIDSGRSTRSWPSCARCRTFSCRGATSCGRRRGLR